MCKLDTFTLTRISAKNICSWTPAGRDGRNQTGLLSTQKTRSQQTDRQLMDLLLLRSNSLFHDPYIGKMVGLFHIKRWNASSDLCYNWVPRLTRCTLMHPVFNCIHHDHNQKWKWYRQCSLVFFTTQLHGATLSAVVWAQSECFRGFIFAMPLY